MALADLEDNNDFTGLKDTRDKALAFQTYITRKIQSRNAKLEAQNNIAEVRIRYERELGKLTARMDKPKNGRPSKSGASEEPLNEAPTYADVGITGHQAHTWQTIAALPDAKFEEVLAGAKENSKEITSKLAYDAGRQHKALEKVSQRKQASLTPEQSSVELIQGDMLDVLRKWDLSRRFDLVIADPPYNVTPWAWDQVGTRDVFMGETKTWLQRCLDVCKPDYNLFWFCSPAYMADIEIMMRSMNLPIQSRIIWHRRNMVKGSAARHKFIDSYEFVFHVGSRELNYPAEWSDAWFDVQTFAVPQTNFNDTKIHPTQKPLDLIKRFVEFGSYPGDLVLDPFAGSGTTGHACLEVKQRQCVLIEREEEYLHGIRQRIAA
jgi:DNA modification methylase